MRRRKIVPSSCKLTATEGQSWPNSAPARSPTKIQVVNERREVAYAAMSRIASHRKSAGINASSGSTCAPTRSDAPTPIVAVTTAAASSLFFISARRRIPSVPKGMLVSAACQWRGASKIMRLEFPRDAAGANLHTTRRRPMQFTAGSTAIRRARPRADRCAWRVAREGSTPAARRPSTAA